MTVVLPVRAARPLLTSRAAGWRVHIIAFAIVAGAIALLFHRDVMAMVTIWYGSSTFNHCFLVLPIIGWLVWQRQPELRQLTPSAWAPGLLVVGAGASAWLLGEAGSLALARHLGLVLMLQGTTIACFGKVVTRALAFPIFYAFFLLPAGEEIVPLMQTITAEMSMALLALVGIPAHIEGVFITIPTGYFEVAAACSGVKFLIAMVAYGALVANVCFRSWTRRLLFMAAAVGIPIIANGIRAWGTIYIAHLTTNDFAEGFDHVFYGWFFFAIVIAAVMGIGWRFFDRKVTDPWFDPAKLQPAGAPSASPRRLVIITVVAAAMAAVPPLWSNAIASSGKVAVPKEIAFPEVPGWSQVQRERGRQWQPHFLGADLLRTARYRDAGGREVDLSIAVFASQEDGREIVAYGQGAMDPEGPWAWTATAKAPRNGRADRIASFGTVREVLTFYRVGSTLTGSDFAVKLETMKTRLFGGPQRAVAVLVSAEQPSEGISPRPQIDAFLQALGPIEPLADGAAGLPRP
jgi:exosortase A